MTSLCGNIILSLTGVPRLVYGEAVLAWAESVHCPLYNTARHQLGQSDDSLGTRGEVVTAHPQHGHTSPQYTYSTVQYSTEYSTVQYSTVQYSTVGTGRSTINYNFPSSAY